METEILGIKVTNLKKQEVISVLEQRIAQGKKTFIVTPYSEFFYKGFYDYEFKKTLNSADISLPDSVSVQWLAYFLSIPFSARSFYGKVSQAFWQVAYSGAEIIFNSRNLKKIIPERISGADFFWDLVKLAEQKNLRIFLLGGFGKTPEQVAEKIKKRFPGVHISGFSNLGPKDELDRQIIEQINLSDTDILMVAYGPVKQENWIAKNLQALNVKVAIGLGGTFDYIAGKKIRAPRAFRALGLEWLFRLISQPTRIRRIWNATFGLVRGSLRYKVFMSMPYRENVVGVIINKENKIFAAKRGIDEARDTVTYSEEHWQFPQGGVDKGEDPAKAVVREVQEEVNISAVEIIAKSKQRNYYFWNNAIRPLFHNRFKYKGQAQTIFYLKYLGDQSEIKLDNRELIEYKWIASTELTKVIHPVRASLVQIILEDLPDIYAKLRQEN